jgi:hypothetical protein
MTVATDTRSARRTILLVALAVIAPVLLAYAAYYLFPRGTFTNYGELLPTVPMTDVAGVRIDGAAFRLSQTRGRWTLVVAAHGACDSACASALYAMRQARTIQGREMDRIERVWLVTDGVAPAAALLAEHPGLIVVRTDAAAATSLPRGTGAIHLVDPLGNQVLAWPRDPDIKRLAGDLARLLKASRIG